MGLKDNIGFAIEESDKTKEAIPFMTLVELDEYLTKMVQKQFNRKDMVVTVDVDTEQVFLGNKDAFDDDNVLEDSNEKSGIEDAEEVDFKEVA